MSPPFLGGDTDTPPWKLKRATPGRRYARPPFNVPPLPLGRPWCVFDLCGWAGRPTRNNLYPRVPAWVLPTLGNVYRMHFRRQRPLTAALPLSLIGV